MRSLKQLISSPTFLATLGVIAIVAFVLLTARNVRTAVLVLESLLILGLLIGAVIWLRRRWKARRASDDIAGMMDAQADEAERRVSRGKRREVAALRHNLQAAIRSIRGSRLGGSAGRGALYELPWYMLIGNPAAGKSSAILNSGLSFPLEAHSAKAVRGVGGTRNCDWFFSSEGILLDTAGRYSIYQEDRAEWLAFLDLLRKHRPRAPLNGVIITASVAELQTGGEAFARELALKLRERVQEITDRLEVSVPLYIVFTKVDLMAGFREFFQRNAAAARDQVWGATIACETNKADTSDAFSKHFDLLHRGLVDSGTTRLTQTQARGAGPAVFGFPLEFAALKTTLQQFTSTLFEENPFQYKPLFRGFYFTSAMQEGEPASPALDRVARRFDLGSPDNEAPPLQSASQGFFLKQLFKRVIFPDQGLARRLTRPRKLYARYAFFTGAVATLGLLFGLWTLSFTANRQLLADVEHSVLQARSTQQNQHDLQSRFEALYILQQRIEQLEAWEQERPLRLGWGLYQGSVALERLQGEYLTAVRPLMLEPVQTAIEDFLARVTQHAGGFESEKDSNSDRTGSRYESANPRSVQDSYNALKTYLMLADAERVDVTHLYDQIARFWRAWLEANLGGMPREDMVRHGERVISFYLGHVSHARWPEIEPRWALVADLRERLTHVMTGLPAVDRLYESIKARASTRYPPVTVTALLGTHESGERSSRISGSHAISGSFSKAAWDGYIRAAIEQAATRELASEDWVLRQADRAELTLPQSADEIRRTLTDRYKAEYAGEWRKFMGGLNVTDFGGFAQAVQGLETLGDPLHSPVRRLLTGVALQTGWDGAGDDSSRKQAGAATATNDSGLLDWFKRVVLRRTPHQINRASYYVDSDSLLAAASGKDGAQRHGGALASHFSGVRKLLERDASGSSLIAGYLEQLRALRTRLVKIENEGDPGPGSNQLMRQTLAGEQSELTAGLAYVESDLLPALPPEQRDVLRPFLLRPLIQTFVAVVEPAERELNQQWQAQVYTPYVENLAHKSPFSPDAAVKASTAEIKQIFGPDGAVVRFANTSLEQLVIRRGNTMTARTWADIGLNLNPQFVRHFAGWAAPLDSAGKRRGSNADAPQTVFQILPLPAPGTRDYSIEIDGQQLSYRNTTSQWSNFVWPNPGSTPGVKLSATTLEGATLTLVDLPGRFGLQKLIESSEHERLSDNEFALSWQTGEIRLDIKLRIISNPRDNSGDNSEGNPRDGSRQHRINALHLPARIVGETTRLAGTR